MRYDFEEEQSGISKRLLKEIGLYLLAVLVTILLSFLMVHFGLATMTVSGDGMSPVLKNGDKILINKMSYHCHRIHRNDVIVVRENGSEHHYYTVQRVIGLPGETVQIKSGLVYINGKKLNEKFKYPKIQNGGLALQKIVLEDKEYFVLGDNRNSSTDSRNTGVGNILKSDIIGKAEFRLNTFAIISKLDLDNTKQSNKLS